MLLMNDSKRYLDFLAIVVGSVFDGGGDSVGIGEGLGGFLAVDLIGPVGSSNRHGVYMCVMGGWK